MEMTGMKCLSACSKTFGLKNKNKSAKVQQYVQQVQQQTKGQTAQKADAAAVKKVSCGGPGLIRFCCLAARAIDCRN